ncbi:MAG TPA: PHP-associated domain-containing protein [Vicinamibacteria bacterium]|jgi:predicted metal-dependent phosphoesterase TrpH|nr:PHP-associated domain-containing protein [Vicinamibacteria bacterium]
MRCDLHVHSKYSGPLTLPVLRRLVRECYSEPAAVYEAALARGMDLVTLTDHDSIEGALQLAGRPDFFVGEEVTCVLPEGRELHLGVFDITEGHHATIQNRRHDAESLFAYLTEERIPFCVNHLFSPLTGRREVSDFHLALAHAPLIEALNGMLPAQSNEFSRLVGRAWGLAPVGGSDAHDLAGVARAYTTVPRARSKDEFLAGLRQGLTVPAGKVGNHARLMVAVFSVAFGAFVEGAVHALRSPAEGARLAALLTTLPALALVPLVALAKFTKEKLGAAAFYRRFLASQPALPDISRPKILGRGLALGGGR